MGRLKIWAGALAMSLAASTASASTIAYDVPDATVGNQSWTGVLGMLFEVNSPINILSLGAFDSAGDGFSAGTTIVVELWSRTGGTGDAILAIADFTSTSEGTLVGGSRFKATGSAIPLAPGEYAIVSYGYNSSDPNGNSHGADPAPWSTNDGGGLLSFVGSSQYDGPPGSTIGNIVDGGPENRYAAGTFTFAAVPLPAALPLLAGGLGLLGLVGRRRKRAAA